MTVDIKKRIDDFETYLSTQTQSSIGTIKKYKLVVRMFLYDNLGKIEQSHGGLSVTTEIINNWLSKKNETKNTTAYKFALRMYLISLGYNKAANSLLPAKIHTRKKVFKYIPKPTMQNIINALPQKWKYVALIQLKTGARIGSILTLRAENFDFDISPNLIYMKVGVNQTMAKRNKEHTLRLHKKYEAVLRFLMKKPWGFIFLESKWENVPLKKLMQHIETQTRYYDMELTRVGRIFGVENLSSHYLRHLYSDYFLQAGGDPMYLKESLGHSKIETTMRYVSIFDKKVDETVINMG